MLRTAYPSFFTAASMGRREFLRAGALGRQTSCVLFFCLRSEHDAAVHTKPRYTRGHLRSMLEEVGLRVERITYRNTFLFPVAAVVRLGQRLFRKPASQPRSDLHTLPGPLNRVLALPLLLENRLFRVGARLPFGLSLYGVARKG